MGIKKVKEGNYWNPMVNKEMSLKCIVGFDKCGYRGNYHEVCEEIKSIKTETKLTDVKSLYIPQTFGDLPVYLHTKENFQGDHAEFNESNACIKNISKSFFFLKKGSTSIHNIHNILKKNGI